MNRFQKVVIGLGLVAMLAEDLGEPPLLLLDDVFSELDAQRRQGLFEALGEEQQAVITCTDLESLPAAARAGAIRLHIRGGALVDGD